MTWEDIRYFEPSEFACHCGKCGSTGEEMALDFVEKLDDLRHRLGHPLIITSGFRCSLYNDQVSTTGFDGPHTTGRAADVSINGEQAFHLVRQCTLGGWMSGIGINQTGPHLGRFIHLDDLAAPRHPRPRIWTY